MSTYGLWLSAAGMQVSEHRQTVLANNLANANTTAFKHDLAVVRQRRVESSESSDGFGFVHPVLDGISGGLETQQTHIAHDQGDVERTGRPLDLAIQGEGFFTVSDGETTRFTRDGVLTKTARGELALSAGGGRWKLLDGSGSPVTIEQGQGKVRVTPSGIIYQGENAVAELQLVTHPDSQQLRKVGENLFENIGDEQDMIPASGAIVGEAKELSNFDMMRGLASMIQASRAYQLNATMVQLQDSMTGQAITRVGKVA